MKVKRYLALVMVISMMALSACGRSAAVLSRNSDRQASEQRSGKDSDQSYDVNDPINNVDQGEDDPNRKPEVSVKLKDERHADFIFDTRTFPDFDFGEDTMFIFYFPNEYEIEWYGVRNGFIDGNEPVQDPELALIFHPEYAGLGEQDIERDDSQMIIHCDLSYKEDGTYVEDFSFAGLSGECRLEYNPPEHLQVGDWFTHEYYYDWDEIIDTGNFTSMGENDHSKELVGIWATDEFEGVEEIDGEWRGYMGAYFYVFYSDGTWSWVSITDSRDGQGYHSVEDNFASWYERNSSSSDHTYYFDGRSIKFTPADDYYGKSNTVDADVDGNTLTMQIDWGKYLDEQNQQIGKYRYYSGL